MKFKIGDVVEFKSRSSDRQYQFTISSIDNGWLWGEDIPQPNRYIGNTNEPNHHSPIL